MTMATIADVARHLGVSRSTVSYALSGKRAISDELKERIRQAVEELDYVPSAAGLALATNRTKVLALLAPMGEYATPQVALQFVHGVATASRSVGYDTLLVTGDEAFRSVRRLIKGRVVDGFVLLDVEEDDARVAELRDAGACAVAIGAPSDLGGLDGVDLDWRRTASVLVGELHRAGHRTIGVIEAPASAHELGMTYATRFREGVAEVVDAGGMSVTEMAASSNYEETAAAVAQMLDRHPETTGLVVQHEAAVAPVVAALRHRGVSVPHEMSIVALTLDALGPQFAPTVSGVHNPSVAITARAVELLVAQLDGDREGPRMELVAPTFVDGGTVAQVGR